MRPRSIRRRAAALAFVGVVGSLGCGARKAASVDGGDDGSIVLLSGRRSFDVVATIGVAGAKVPANLPPTLELTLVLDVDSHLAIVGANGIASAVPYTSTNGHFRPAQFSVGLAPATQCGGASMITFTSFDVASSGSTLSGQAMGAAQVSCGDCQFDVPFQGNVTGVADATPPLLVPAAVPGNPFQSFTLAASEPLPATATARLLASDGSHVDLVPTMGQGNIPIVNGFRKPEVVLPTGVGLAVAVDGLIDFAGLRGSADTPLRLTEFATPPLVPEDGFEGGTATQVGGATVITGGPLPPITGARSVYIGGQGAPAPGGVSVGGSLRVRLAVQPGDSKLRFSYRMVGQYQGSGFAGTINLGSVGRAPASDTFTMTPSGVATTWPDGKTVYVTDAATKEIALPADATDELLVDIEPFGFGCGGPAPPAGGMLLDDLRVE